ncbi:hypothetical protein [Streptomyces sp. NPDC005012]|uniref:hypothetical protein n=1 Tax=unclassified Streptomyces TaxID=2593676 RepID=UPI0033B8046B
MTAFSTVLFDFSGTRLCVESAESRLRGVLRDTGIRMTEEETVRAARELRGPEPGHRA